MTPLGFDVVPDVKITLYARYVGLIRTRGMPFGVSRSLPTAASTAAFTSSSEMTSYPGYLEVPKFTKMLALVLSRVEVMHS